MGARDATDADHYSTKHYTTPVTVHHTVLLLLLMLLLIDCLCRTRASGLLETRALAYAK